MKFGQLGICMASSSSVISICDPDGLPPVEAGVPDSGEVVTVDAVESEVL